MLSFFPRGVLDEILNLIESVSEGFPSYSSKFKVGLKSLLQQGLSEPEFYGDLVYKLRKLVIRANFSDQLRKNIMCYKRIGYNINVMRQSACLVINPITVDSFASVFNCTSVGRADSVTGPTYHLLIYLSWLGLDLVLSVAWSFGFNWWFSFAPIFQWYCFTPWGSPGVTIRFCRLMG